MIWHKKELGKLAEIGDGNHSSKYPKSSEFISEGVPFIRSVNLINGNIGDSDMKFISHEKHIQLLKGHLKTGDILFTNRGQIGKMAIVPPKYNNSNLNSQTAWIRSSEEVFNWYLYYQLGSKMILGKIVDNTNGTALQQLTIKELKKILIPLPPLPEQQKIAEILSTVDAKIEVIDQQITETQVLKKGLMQQLLTGKLSVIEKRTLSSAEMKDSPLGEIPKSWEVVRIGDLGNVVTGSTPKTSVDEFYAEEGILWASPSDLTNIKYVNTTKKKLSPLGFEQTRKLPPKSILVTCIGSTIGKIGMTNSWMSTNQQINSIICSDLNDSEFYYYVIEKNAEAIKSMAGTQAVPLLNKTDFSNIWVIKPNLIEQQKISEILSSIDDKLEVLSEKKTHFQELKQGLMQQLLTGKIRVSSAPL